METLRKLNKRGKIGVYPAGKCTSCGNELSVFRTHGETDITGHAKECMSSRRGSKSG